MLYRRKHAPPRAGTLRTIAVHSEEWAHDTAHSFKPTPVATGSGPGTATPPCPGKQFALGWVVYPGSGSGGGGGGEGGGVGGVSNVLLYATMFWHVPG